MPGNDFANNILSDLGPLIALFGERVTTQFLSHSIGFLDCIIFAMVPLGIITAMSAAIRVSHSLFLKTLIGRAKESRGVIEAELMSSTSSNVCEIWNGQELVRVLGKPDILEMFMAKGKVFSTVELTSCSNQSETESETPLLSIESQQSILRFLTSLLSGSSRDGNTSNGLEQGEAGSAFTKDDEQCAPNISLNFQDPGKYTSLIWGGGLFWRTLFVGCLGVIIQLTVIVYQGLATYYLPYETQPYAKDVYFPLAVAGTLALTIGMFLCSRIIETSTAETVMKVKAGARIFWLQRCSVVNDENFESFLIFTDHPHGYYVTSRQETRSKPVGAASKLLYWIQHGEYKLYLAIPLSLFGFIAQIIGIRALHWTSSLVQIAAIGAMTGLRAWIRLPLSRTPRSRKIPQGYELDWIATRMGRKEDSFWDEMNGNDDNFGRDHCWEWEVVTTRGHAASSRPINLEQDGRRRPKPNNIITSDHSPENEDPKSETSSPSQLTGGTVVSGTRSPPEPNQVAQVLKLRERLGELSAWASPVANEALSLAKSIEVVMNAIFGSNNPLDVHEGARHDDRRTYWNWYVPVTDGKNRSELATFTVTRDARTGLWEASAAELEAFLSVWLYELRDKERANERNRQHDSKRDWLRGTDKARKRQIIHYLCSNNSYSRRDCWWWLPKRISESKVLEVQWRPKDDVEQQGDVQPALDTTDGSRVEIFPIHCVMGFPRHQTNIPDPMDTSSGSTVEVEFRIIPLRSRPTSTIEPESNKGGNLGDSNYIAVVLDCTLELACARELFSAFIWAVAEQMPNSIAGETNLNLPNTITFEPLAEWSKNFHLESDVLSRISQGVHDAGLQTADDSYLSLITALSHYTRLPNPGSIIKLARQKAEHHETKGQWKLAGDVFIWLFRELEGLPEVDMFRSLLCWVFQKVFEMDKPYQHWLKVSGVYQEAKFQCPPIKRELEDCFENMPKLPPEAFEGGTAELQCQISTTNKFRNVGLFVWHWDIFRDLFRHLFNPETTDIFERTALHCYILAVAIFKQHNFDTSLQRAGEDINMNSQDIFGRTALHYAAENGYYYALTDLLIGGAIGGIRARDGGTVLHYSCRQKKDNPKIVIRLLENPEDINIDAWDYFGRTGLHYSAFHGHANISKLLLNRGASATTRDRQGCTPLHLAVFGGATSVVEVICNSLKDEDINAEDNGTLAPIYYAVLSGHREIFELLYQRNSTLSLWGGQSSVLHLMVEKDTSHLIDGLPADGIDINVRDSTDMTPINVAVLRGKKNTVEFLIDRFKDSIDLDLEGYLGWVPLHFAIRTRGIVVKYDMRGYDVSYSQNRTDIAELLLKGGAKPGATDINGRTPLHFAAQATEQLVRLLLEFGAGSNTKDACGNTALHYAIGRSGMKYENNYPKQDMSAFDLDPRDIIPSEKCAIVAELLTHGADVNAMCGEGQAPMHYAVACPDDGMVIIKMLLDKGARTDVQNKEGMTPLDIARNENNEPVVKLLSTMGPARLGDS
ncbi:ankyrin [Wilcoxina mikolae CBS 423.85]|nr:ankyrin [Wilcoxina mikolae CBS 423.85]